MTTQALLSAFPTRPIEVRTPRRSAKPWLVMLVGIVLFGGFGFYLASAIAPDLLSDYRIQDHAVPIEGRIEDGRCRSKFGFLQDCEVTVVVTGNKSGNAVTHRMHYLFADPHLGDYDVVVMGDPSRPDLATTDLGLDNLRSRLLTMLGAVVAMVLLLFGCILVPIQAGRARRDVAAMSGAVLTPMVVRVDPTRQGWSVRTAPKARPRLWTMPRKAQPLWVDPSQNLAAAVTVPGGAVYPLDSELTALDLTEEERYRIQAAAAA
ncbi:hypothetical protein [Roseomonas elaeocarpi]|uniref:DUF3592 domain-containing protein n=1 Tax=Roseomonas elaeocarpi TaxID=907779 RepID=A0ABV6JXR4_9PROT